MQEPAINVRYNIAAFYIAILNDSVTTVEQAFAVLEKTVPTLTKEDTYDMMKMKLEGMSYRAIAEIYGLHSSAVYHRLKRSGLHDKIKKDLSDGSLKRSATLKNII